MSSAVVWFGFGVELSKVIGEVDFVVVVRRREAKAWLLCDFVLVKVLDEGLDRLLLGEDAVGEDRETCVVPPSTFLWTAVVERRFVDGDSGWVLVLPLLVDLISLDGKSCFPRGGVGLAELFDVRHLSASMRISMRMERITRTWIIQSSSCDTDVLRLVIVALPLFRISFSHRLLLFFKDVCHSIHQISVVVLVEGLKVGHGLC